MKPLTFIRGALMACAVTLLCAPEALAAGTGTGGFSEKNHINLPSTATHASSSSSLGDSLVRTIIGLVIVIAVIWGVTWMFKQSRGARNQASGTGLQQVASLPLGTNRSVALVRVGDELHLLGVAEHGITGIRSFTEDEAYELGVPFDPPDGPGMRGVTPLERMFYVFRRVINR
jgi:flagellar protein FliO/FliZ